MDYFTTLFKDAAGTSKDSKSSEVGVNPLLGLGDDHNSLQQLVSEAVKKALRDTDLPSSSQGDLSSSATSISSSDVSDMLVEKVIEGLKPLVARSPPPPPLPPPGPSAPVPSYKPTPISELRKRHIPVPYTPKDTKTILLKRQASGESGTQVVKTKSVATKRREEYVPAVTGKALESDKSSYKPSLLQNYGEAHYSPVNSGIKSEFLYTPSDKSSLPTKTADYVPTGWGDALPPNAFYNPTNQGDSPILEPEYQPDIGNSSNTISYTPSKLDGPNEVSLKKNSCTGQDSALSLLFVETNIPESSSKKTVSPENVENSEVKISVGDSSKTSHKTAKDTSSESHLHNVRKVSHSESRDKDKVKSSSKHSSNHRDSKHHKSHGTTDKKSPKSSSDRKDHKEAKHHKENKDHKGFKDSKDLHAHKITKDNRALKDTKNSKDQVDPSDRERQRNSKESKDMKNRLKRVGSEEQDCKRRCVEGTEGSESKRKEKSKSSNHSSESKSKSESSSQKVHKDRKTNVDKHSVSHSKHSSQKHTSKPKVDGDGVKSVHREHNSSSKKAKCSTKDSSNNGKDSGHKSASETNNKNLLKRKHSSTDSFEEMEAILQGKIRERVSTELTLGESDTDEDTITEECLRIFNSYKPEETQDAEVGTKKLKTNEEEPDAAAAPLLGKKRLAHDAAAHVIRPATAQRKNINPSTAMMQRLAKWKGAPAETQVILQKDMVSQKPMPSTTSGANHGKRRIAHVPNVSKLLDAKEKIIAVVQNSKVEPTISQTVAKGSQRVAHIPPRTVTTKPIITAMDGSKIPTNVRQKYCNLMFEELLKKIESPEECTRMSLAEEESCFTRSSSRTVYVNLAIITIKRLRSMDAQDAKDGSGKSKCTLSHDDMIGGKSKAQGLWSIIPPKKLPPPVDESTAYQMMLDKYVMTDEELLSNGYPRPHPTEKGRALLMETLFRSRTKSKNYFERICDRCGKEYFVNEKGLSRYEEQCVYHWGRPFKTRGIGGLETRYSCCQGEARAEGCSVWNCHVSDMFDPDNQAGFVKTLEKPDASNRIFSLDCEMCYTTEGTELIRVTVINFHGDTVFDTLVKPERPVLDYCTRFSGITEEDMAHATKTLIDVQATLLSMFHKGTILIGHSLDSDLKSLKLIHSTVVDTSLVFPHRRGPPFKRALKSLCAEYLQKIIQNGDEGHDSAEDALACIELMKWRIKEDLKAK